MNRAGTGLSLRATLLLMIGIGAIYVAGIAVYMATGVRPAAASLQTGAEPIVEIFTHLSRRSDELNRAVIEARRLAVLGDRADPEAIAAVRALVSGGEGRVSPGPLASVPPAMRTALARADDETLRLENTVLEAVALIELGRYEEASVRVLAADSLELTVDRHLRDAEHLGLVDLSERARKLTDASGRAVEAVIWWVLLGLLILPVVVYVAWRRIAVPLSELEQGLAEVAEGNLNVEVPVRSDDELGRLCHHFNEMTRVVRTRAHEQGRFAAAGELLAGVAHEVNNPLMAIAALASTRLAEPDLDPETRAELEQIVRQSGRAGKLVTGLLRFVRPDDRPVGAVDVNRILGSALDLVSYQFHVDEIDVERRLDLELPPALGHPGRLEQVFVNLLSNAIDALRSVSGPRKLRIESWVDRDQVLAAVADNGPGIPPGIDERLFRPFVTTKQEKGTGLGLYISREIVREVEGELTLDPEWEPGARFVVALPRVDAVEDVALGRADRDTGSAGSRGSAPHSPLGGLRVLLVEDERAIRAPIVKYLERRGAEVMEAANGREALEVVERADVDVIVADLRMPTMDGIELYTHLCATRPELSRCLLFLSGDVSRLDGPLDAPIPRERVILKPVELADLEARIIDTASVTTD